MSSYDYNIFFGEESNDLFSSERIEMYQITVPVGNRFQESGADDDADECVRRDLLN